jgi:hypothetical protein
MNLLLILSTLGKRWLICHLDYPAVRVLLAIHEKLLVYECQILSAPCTHLIVSKVSSNTEQMFAFVFSDIIDLSEGGETPCS